MKCGWSWSLMVVVVRIWSIIIVGNAHSIRVMKKFGTFSVTNGMKNARIPKSTFDFFTERDGLNGYFWLQFIEKGLIFQMCNEFLLWKLHVENLHILHQSNKILHIFVEPFILLVVWLCTLDVSILVNFTSHVPVIIPQSFKVYLSHKYKTLW